MKNFAMKLSGLNIRRQLNSLAPCFAVACLIFLAACDAADTLTDNVTDAVDSASEQVSAAVENVKTESEALVEKVGKGGTAFIEEIKK